LFQRVENASKVVKGRRNSTDLYKAQPNENFTRAMFPDFLISSVAEYKRGMVLKAIFKKKGPLTGGQKVEVVLIFFR
jgi:hypothetical protein